MTLDYNLYKAEAEARGQHRQLQLFLAEQTDVVKEVSLERNRVNVVKQNGNKVSFRFDVEVKTWFGFDSKGCDIGEIAYDYDSVMYFLNSPESDL